MSIGLIGRKVGMTRIFTEEGGSVPVTVIEATPNRITQLRTAEKDGYRALQVTAGTKKTNRVNKAEAGHFAKAGVEAGKNPRDVKVLLAKEIIARFHSEADADAAEQEFVNRFAKNQVPDEMPEFEFEAGLPIANVLKEAGLVNSTSDAMRMIKQGAAKIEGEKIEDSKLVPAAGTAVYQVGKRKFARITIK